MTREEKQEIADLIAANTQHSSKFVDMFFRGVLTLCLAGVSWLVVNLPVTTERVSNNQMGIAENKVGLIRIEDKVGDRYTDDDAERDNAAQNEKIIENKTRIAEMSNRQREGFERIQALEVMCEK